MANNNWAPKAVAVQEVITVTVGGTLAGETLKLGLGDPVGADELQTATVTGAGSGGTFTLTVPLPNGSEMTTATIAYDANAATIETALDTAFALVSPAPPAGSISVAGTDMDTGDITFTFDGAVYEKKDWPLVTVPTLATGWSAAVFAETTKGLPITGIWIAEHTDVDHSIATAVAALFAAWNASTHPWAAAVTAADASPNITLTADTAGVPFGDFLTDTDQAWETGVRGYYEITLNTPGGAATLVQDETTASQGPNHANLAANWSNGTYLANGDEVTIADSGVDILWGLDYGSDATNKVTLNSLDIRKSMSGKIGLDSATFGGLTSAPECRGDYFKILVDSDYGDVTIGKQSGPGSSLGSRRIKLDLLDQECRVEMYGSNSQPFETGKSAVRILLNHATSKVHVRGATGGFGIAMDHAGEASLASVMSVNCPSLSDKIYVGAGVEFGAALGSFQLIGGYCKLRQERFDVDSALLGNVIVDGGELWTEGDFELTSLDQNGGVIHLNHYNTGTSRSGVAVTTCNFNAGVCDTTDSMRARVLSTVNQVLNEHSLLLKGEAVTIADYNLVALGEGRSI